MKLKKHTKEGTFKMRSPNGTIHEVPNSHRKSIEKIMKNGGKVEAYLKKLGMGGEPPQQGQDQQMQQIMQMVAQALQQGQKPEQVMQMLVQQGITQEVVQQVIQQVMQQMQEQQAPPQEGMDTGNQEAPMMKFGGLPMAEWGTNTLGINGTSNPKLYQPKTDALQIASQDVTGSTINPDANSHLGFDDSMSALPTDANGIKNNPNQLPFNQILNKQPGQDNPTAPQLGANSTQLTGTDPTNVKSPYAFTGKYYNTGIQKLDRAHNDLVDSAYYKKLAGDPNTSEGDKKRYGKLSKLNNFTSGANSFGLVMDTARLGVGAFANQYRQIGDQLDANEHQRLQASVDGEITKKDRGDRSQLGNGTYAGYAKYGNKLPMLQHGGMQTEGSDFGSEDPNVMTERGETISDPTQGPVGPNGQPTGLVVHDKTGDEHSDPSGGNPLKLGSNSVVHSKSLGITVGAFVEYAQQFPNAEFIIETVLEKYKDPNKEVTYADLAKLFDTKELVKEVTMIAKKLDKEEAKIGNSNNTPVANKTAELNAHTLKLKEAKAKEEMAENSQATGAEGPIYNLAENLKGAGAYGKQLQKETLDPSQAPTKFGGKMKNGGIISPNFKKIKQAKYGYNTEAPGIPTMGYTGKIVATGKDESNYYSQGEDGKWYYSNPGHELTEVPADTGPNKKGVTLQPMPVSTLKDNKAYPQVQPYMTPTNNTPYPGNYGDPAEYDQWVNDVSGSFDTPMFNYLHRAHPYNIGTVQQTVNANMQQQVQDAYLSGAIPFNKSHEAIFNSNNPKHKGPISDKEYIEFFSTKPTLINQGFADKQYGVDRVIPKKIHFKNEQDPEYLKWIATQEKIGDRYRLKNLPLGTGKGVEYYKPDFDPITGEVKKEEPKKDAQVQQVQASVAKGPLRNKRIFQEGLNPAQVAGPIMDLLARKQAVPYIEDKGAADAMAMNTRQRFTDLQPQLNRLTRDVQARTRFSGRDSVAQAQGAQYAANAYEAANQVYGQKYNADNQIENQYNQQQLQLRMQAGTNKAKAQEELATRTATRDWKDYAMRRNAVGEIGNKYEQQVANNRSAALYQDMFDQYGLNPNFTSSFVNGKQLGINPFYNNPLTNKPYTNKEQSALLKAQAAVLDATMDASPTSQKFGGKVKKSLPKKMIKSKRVK